MAETTGLATVVLRIRLYDGSRGFYETQLWTKEHDFAGSDPDPILLKAETPLYDFAQLFALEARIGNTLWYHPVATYPERQPLLGSLPRFGYRRLDDTEAYDLAEVWSEAQISPQSLVAAVVERSSLDRAAPDLLESLKGVLRVADRSTDEFDAARAAIAKAEGRAS